MNTILAFSFDDTESCNATMSTIEALGAQGLLELRDAVALHRKDDGALENEVLRTPIMHGAAAGGVLGTLAGLVTLHPLIGAAAGTLLGAFRGAQPDIVVSDAFIEAVAETLQPGRSALLVQLDELKSERVLEELRGLRGDLVHTSFEAERDTRWKQVLRGHHPTTDRSPGHRRLAGQGPRAEANA